MEPPTINAPGTPDAATLSKPLVVVEQVSVQFSNMEAEPGLRQRLARIMRHGRNAAEPPPFIALRNVSLTLEVGDRVALIGPNGAGKTTLLRVLAGAYTPMSGRVEVSGRIATMLSLGLFIDPYETGLENVETGCLMMDMTSAEIAAAIPRIVEFADLGDFINRPVRTYSSGMMVRLAFAVASEGDADILLIDEGIGLGDQIFKAKVRQRISDLAARSKLLVVASHSSGVLRALCNKGIFLRQGEIAFNGTLEDTIAAYDRWVADGRAGSKVEHGMR